MDIDEERVRELATNLATEFTNDIEGEFWGFTQASLMEFAKALLEASK